MVYGIIASAPIDVASIPIAIGLSPALLAFSPIAMEDDPIAMAYAPIAMGRYPITIEPSPICMESSPIAMGTDPIAMGLPPIDGVPIHWEAGGLRPEGRTQGNREVDVCPSMNKGTPGARRAIDNSHGRKPVGNAAPRHRARAAGDCTFHWRSPASASSNGHSTASITPAGARVYIIRRIHGLAPVAIFRRPRGANGERSAIHYSRNSGTSTCPYV